MHYRIQTRPNPFLCIELVMPGQAKSKTTQARDHNDMVGKWMTQAVEMYRDKQAKGDGETKLGLKKVCQVMQVRCWEENHVQINLDKETLRRQLAGVKSQAQSNTERGCLTPEEENTIVDYAINMVDMGWPLSLQRMKEHAEEVCQGHHSETFPGLGKNWMKCFAERHQKRLKPYWSCSLDESQARAGNPTMKKAFFNLLEETIKGEEGDEPVADELIYRADESGIQEGIRMRE